MPRYVVLARETVSRIEGPDALKEALTRLLDREERVSHIYLEARQEQTDDFNAEARRHTA